MVSARRGVAARRAIVINTNEAILMQASLWRGCLQSWILTTDVLRIKLANLCGPERLAQIGGEGVKGFGFGLTSTAAGAQEGLVQGNASIGLNRFSSVDCDVSDRLGTSGTAGGAEDGGVSAIDTTSEIWVLWA